LAFLAQLIQTVFTLFYVAILARIIFSFVIPMLGGRPHPIILSLADLAIRITEPLLAPIRRFVPTFGSLDFSPLVAIILLQVIQWILIRAILR